MEKKGIIYEIVCNDTGERYIGSTTNKYLSSRIAHHRHQQSTCCSKQIINRNNYCYNILETIIINNIKELRIKEREYYDKLECINVRPPYCNDKQLKETDKIYRDTHKEQINNYYQNNKEKIKARRKERWILLKK